MCLDSVHDLVETEWTEGYKVMVPYIFEPIGMDKVTKFEFPVFGEHKTVEFGKEIDAKDYTESADYPARLETDGDPYGFYTEGFHVFRFYEQAKEWATSAEHVFKVTCRNPRAYGLQEGYECGVFAFVTFNEVNEEEVTC